MFVNVILSFQIVCMTLAYTTLSHELVTGKGISDEKMKSSRRPLKVMCSVNKFNCHAMPFVCNSV